MAKAFNLTAQINLQGPANIGKVVGKIKKDLGSINADVKFKIDPKAEKSVANITAKLKVMNSVLAEAKGHTDGLNASLSKLSSSLGRTGASTSKISRGLKQTANEAVSAAKNLKQAENAMTGLGKQAAITIKRFAAFSIVSTAVYGTVNAINSAYKAFLEFDKEMIRLQQITGSGAVAIGKLSSVITELSTTLGVSSTELSRVAVTLAQAGLTASQTEQALSSLAKTELAPSFENLSKTTEGAIAAIRQFGLESQDLEKALGSINAVASKFAVESGDIIAAIQRTGGVFASASKGVSEGTDALNEFIAVFTSVRATTRESAETIATGLRTIFTRIQRGSTIEYLKQFNIELQDSEGNFVGAYEAIKRLSEGLKGLDTRDVRFTRIVEELGGFRQIGKVIPLIQEFGTAQEALAVAQKGQGSLTDAAAKAQQSLIVQLAKVREEFNALIRSVGESKTFKTFLSITLQTTRALIGLAAVFKPILPLLAILGTIKAVSSIGKFGAGFSGALKKGGGSKGVGQTIGEKLTGASEKEKSDAVSRAANATNQNTTALKTLTSAVNALTQKIGNFGGGGGGGGSILGPDGRPYRFASGGIVPGSGNRDTVPAMLTPGEFVIRKKAVETLGAGNLHKMNKYASGGLIKDQDAVGSIILEYEKGSLGDYDIDKESLTKFAKSKGYKPAVLKDIKDRSSGYKVVRSSFGNKFVYDKFDQAINRGIISGINSSIAELQKAFGPYSGLTGIDIGSGPKSESIRKTFYESINEGVRGNMFEDIFQAAVASGGKFTGGPKDFWDFQNGLGPAAGYFPGIENIKYIEARASGARSTPSKVIPKILNQMGLENNTVADPNKPDTISGTVEEVLGNLEKNRPYRVNEIAELMKISGESLTQTKRDKIREQLRASMDEVKPGFFQLKSLGGFIQKFAEGGQAESIVNQIQEMSAIDAIDFYTNKSRRLNTYYDKGKESELNDTYKSAAKTLDQLFNDDIPGIVYAGFGASRTNRLLGNPDNIMDLENVIGNKVTFPAYFSTSEYRDVASDFSQRGGGLNSVSDIRTKGKGIDVEAAFERAGAEGRSIERWNTGEYEYILPRGSSFRIDNAENPYGGNSLEFDLTQLARGGMIQKFANGGSAEDTVPALLTPGEFVINKKAAARIGASNLHRMNRADKIRGFNRGGSVGFVQRFADGGAPVGGLGYPGSMYTNPANEAKTAAEALEALKEAAQAAGMSVRRYEKTIKDQIKTLASSKVSEKEATRKDLAAILVRNRGEIKKAGEGSKEIQVFKDTLIAKLRDLDLDLPVENIEKEVVSVINSIKSGLPVDDILKSSDILKRAMDDSGDAAKALKEAHEELSASVGDLTENMKVSAEELANARYVNSGQAERDFGAFGKFAPGAARDFSQSDRGRSSLKWAKDFLAMRNIPLVGQSLGKLNDVVMDMEGPLGNAARGVGGLAGAAAIATSILGSQLPEVFKALGLGQNATAAGVAGGLAQGGSMAASLATVGSQIFGAPGAVGGLLVGAITGAISGFAKAFRTKNLENKLGELNTTLEGVNKAFENLEKNRNAETIRAAQGALGGLSKNFEELMLEAQRTPFEALTSTSGVTGIAGALGGLGLIGLGAAKLAGGVSATAGTGGIAGAVGIPVAWMGVADIVAGMGLAAYSVWSIFSSFNPDEIDKEAFEAGLKAAEEYINGLQKLAEQEINLKSLETIKDTLDPIQEAYDKIEEDQKSGNITAEEAKTRRQNLNIELGKKSGAIEQAQFAALASEGYTVDPLKPLADQLSTIDSRGQKIAQEAKDAAAYKAGVAELNRIYGEGSDIAMEKAKNEQAMIKRGNELLGIDYKQQLIQAELAATYRETRIEVENLIDKFDKVNAVLNRFGRELDELSRQGDILAGVGRGEAELGPINRTNEAMLANMRAYSDTELAPVIEQVGRIVGGQTGSQLTEGLQARRILQENLPDILTNVSSQDTERVETEVRALFDKAGLSEDLGRAFAEQVRTSLDQQVGSRQGKSFQELSQEFPALQDSMNLIEKQFEASSNALKQYNDAIEQSNEFITRWGQAIEKSREITLRSAQLEIETRNKLLRATGGYVGPTQENEAFLEQIKSLTGGRGVQGNQILVDEIGKQYNDLRKQVEDQRALVDATQDFAERQKQTKKLDELNRQMNNSYAALEEIANNTSMIDSMISAIERNRQRSEAAGRFLEYLYSSTPLELADTTLDLNMLNDFLDLDLDNPRDRNRASQQFSTAENRQRVVRGLDFIQNSGLLGEQEMGRLRAEAQIQMLEQMQIANPNFGKQKIVTMETYNPETKEFEIGEKISLEDAIRRRASGEYEDPMKEALTDQLRMQNTANDYLKKIADNTAKEYQDTLAEAVNNMVTNLPGMIANAIAESRAESEARDKESPTSADGSASGSPAPPEPEIFGAPDVAKIRSDLEAANQATGEAMRDLQKIRDRREGLWFDIVGPYPQEIELEEKIAKLKEKELALQKQLEEAIRKQMDKQREDAGYTPLPPSDEEINRLSQQYQDAIKATGDAMLELEKYKIANPGSKTGPYPGYPRGKSTPERERLEAKVRAAELIELESRKKLEEATREREQYRQREEEDFNIPPEWKKPEKPTLPATPDKPIPVVVQNPRLPLPINTPVTMGPMGGCCNEILDEIRLLKQALIANTFLMDLGNTISNAFTGVNIPLDLEPTSRDFLNNFQQSFNTYVTRLENAFPEQIQMVGRHIVSVSITGGEVFNEMENSIRTLIITEIDKELREYSSRNGMPQPPARGNPV